jgi:hypothetical protein
MKSKFFLSLLIVCSLLIFSCSKSTPVTNTITHDTTIITHDTTILTHDTVIVKSPLNPIVGLWVGTLTAINEPSAGALYYSFDIRADSTILTQSEGADGNTYFNHGTWSLSGSAFSATTSADLTGVVQTITAVYSDSGRLSSGVWANKDGSASGTFALKRIN